MVNHGARGLPQFRMDIATKPNNQLAFIGFQLFDCTLITLFGKS